MARTIGIITDCSTSAEGNAIINFCVTVMPEEGDTFPTQTHYLEYIANGEQTTTQINNGIQDEAIAQMALLDITVTKAKFVQTKFS